jgi:hypothetical protein
LKIEIGFLWYDIKAEIIFPENLFLL